MQTWQAAIAPRKNVPAGVAPHSKSAQTEPAIAAARLPLERHGSRSRRSRRTGESDDRIFQIGEFGLGGDHTISLGRLAA